jgi:hypothetical protein
MLCVLFATDPAIKSAGIKTILYHPGHVATDLGLTGGQEAKIDVAYSNESILEMIERATHYQLSKAGAPMPVKDKTRSRKTEG